MPMIDIPALLKKLQEKSINYSTLHLSQFLVKLTFKNGKSSILEH